MSKKIGRNDPCPCGSGKKYKNNAPVSCEVRIFDFTFSNDKYAMQYHEFEFF